MTGEISVFVPARNAGATIRQCLEHIQRSTPPGTRITVLNDHSTDDTVEVARSLGVEIVEVPGEGGLGRARNLALDQCATRYLVFFNADCNPSPDWTRVLMRELRTASASVAGGKQIELRRGTLAERWKSVHLRQDLGDADIDQPDFLSGGNLLMDLAMIDGIRFGEQYRSAYEDVDFCRRLREAGGRLIYRPEATVGHNHPETMRTLRRKVWSYGVHSKSVGDFSGATGAVRAFARMHRRPNDQLRRSIRSDLRAMNLQFLAVDMLLLAASLKLFLEASPLSADLAGR
jgi:GT2 family glycosyltransferase